MADDTYILTASDIDEMAGVSKTHFLNPEARRLNKSLGDMAGLTGFGFHLIEVEPGHQTTEHHCHHHEDECVFVLSGSATAVIGNEERVIRAGDFIGYRKGGLAHSIRNTGSEVLRCIVVGERRAHDVCDYPLLGKRLYRQSGMASHLVDVDRILELGDHVGKK